MNTCRFDSRTRGRLPFIFSLALAVALAAATLPAIGREATPPGVPRDVSAARDVHAIVLTWRIPADDGGSPVRFFSVYRADSAAGPLVRKALLKAHEDNRYVEYGIEPGATYHYAIAAVNDVGEGAFVRVVGEAGGAPARYAAIESVHGKIWDVTSSRFLFVRPPNPDVLLRQENRSSGAIRSIPVPAGKSPARGFLAPRGVIYVAGGRVNEAEAASPTITDLGKILTPAWLTVEGDHAAWRSGDDLWYRDLVARTRNRIVLSLGSHPETIDVARNGDVVFTEASPFTKRVWRYRDGILTNLGVGFGAETDGIDVLLLKTTTAGRTAIILYHEGERVPGTIHSQVRPDFPSFDVAGGWIAYSRYPLDSAEGGIWLRGLTGLEFQVSGTTASGPIYALSPEGEVMYRGANGHLYLGRPALPPLDLGLDYFDGNGRGGGNTHANDGNWVFWESGAWYAVIGGTLFGVDTQNPLSPIQTLSDAGADATFPQVAVDANGNAVFTWRLFNLGTIQARARAAAGGILSPIQVLSETGTDSAAPQLAVDPSGNAVFTWARSLIETRARTADGTLSAVTPLSTPGRIALHPHVAVAPDGTAVFIWRESDERVRTRARSADGSFSPIQTLPNSDFDFDVKGPRVAVDADGNAVFIWRFGASLNLAARAADGTLSPTQELSTGTEPRIAVDPAGNAVVVSRLDVSRRIRYQTRTADGTLSEIQYLSEDGQPANMAQVAVDANGNAVFTWRRSDGANWRIQARVRAADGTLSPVEDLSAAGQHALDPQVAVDPSGRAVFTWRRLEGTKWRIQARARAADGTLGPVEDVSEAGRDAYEPQVAVDPSGNAVFAWRLFDGTNHRIQTRARSAE
jgi:lactonase family protein with 7-bladed beta-propeller